MAKEKSRGDKSSKKERRKKKEQKASRDKIKKSEAILEKRKRKKARLALKEARARELLRERDQTEGEDQSKSPIATERKRKEPVDADADSDGSARTPKIRKVKVGAGSGDKELEHHQQQVEPDVSEEGESESEEASSDEEVNAPPSAGPSTGVSKADGDAVPDRPLFVIDTNPTKVVPPVYAPAGTSGTQGEGADAQQNADGSTMPSKKERRRQKLIQEQERRIRKQLKLAPDSTERSDEVKRLLDVWIAKEDAKAQLREQKKAKRAEMQLRKLKWKHERGRVKSGEKRSR